VGAHSAAAAAPLGALAPTEQPIAAVFCAGYSTFFVTAEDACGAGGGFVFAAGLNSYGQLGLGHTRDADAPTAVPSLSPPHAPGGGVLQIVGGAQHTLALMRDGGVMAFGRGDSGQLGLGAVGSGGGGGAAANQLLPVAASAFLPRQIAPARFGEGDHVAWVTANNCSSAAVTSGGRLFTWGFGEPGHLAGGRQVDSAVPLCVSGEGGVGDLRGAAVEAAGLGGQHLVVIARVQPPPAVKGAEWDVVEDPPAAGSDEEAGGEEEEEEEEGEGEEGGMGE
jgi:regulator of chromosome condensation